MWYSTQLAALPAGCLVSWLPCQLAALPAGCLASWVPGRHCRCAIHLRPLCSRRNGPASTAGLLLLADNKLGARLSLLLCHSPAQCNELTSSPVLLTPCRHCWAAAPGRQRAGRRTHWAPGGPPACPGTDESKR